MIKRKNILFLTARPPWPLVGGDRVKPYYLLKHLGKNHNVDLVSFWLGKGSLEETISALKDIGINPHFINLNKPLQALSILPKLFFFLPLEILYFYNKRFGKKVDSLLNSKKYDIGFSFFMRTAEYLKSKKMNKVLIAEDCRVVYQNRSYLESSVSPQKFVRLWEWKTLELYEPKISDHFDLTTLVSEEDVANMQKNNPQAKFKLLTNGTDTDAFSSSDAKRDGLLFSGRMDVWANQLMAKRILYKIFPKIREEIPNAKLRLVGAWMPDWMKNLKQDGVEIHEDVPSMIPYLQEAQLFIHPHSGGSGIQNKLLEAMSCETVVLTTKTGNQGIHGEDGKDLFIAYSDEEFAKKAIDILKDKELANEVGKNARELILNTHSWHHVNDVLDDIIEEYS